MRSIDPRTFSRKLLGTVPYLRFLLSRRPPRDIATDVIEVDTWFGSLLVHRGSASITRELIANGVYDLDVCLAIRRIVKPGMTVLNIGANVGIYTLLAAQRVGAFGKVFAFEPDPRSYALLRKNSAKFPGIIDCVPEAVSNVEGDVMFTLDAVEPGDSSFVLQKGKKTSSTHVHATTVDRFCRERGIHANVIIMDIQGAEPLAFEGMRQALTSNTLCAILFECSPKYSENMGTSVGVIPPLLHAEGFRLQHIRGSALPDPENAWPDFLNVLRARKGGYGFCNLLAVREA